MRTDGQSGFTLIELLVILAILAGAVAIIASRANDPRGALSLKAATDEIAASLREARSVAILSGNPASVEIDAEKHTWLDAKSHSSTLPTDLRLDIRSAAGLTKKAKTAAFEFESDGSSTGGSIQLVQRGRLCAINIHWITGQVAVDCAR